MRVQKIAMDSHFAGFAWIRGVLRIQRIQTGFAQMGIQCESMASLGFAKQSESSFETCKFCESKNPSDSQRTRDWWICESKFLGFAFNANPWEYGFAGYAKMRIQLIDGFAFQTRIHANPDYATIDFGESRFARYANPYANPRAVHRNYDSCIKWNFALISY